MQIKTHYCSLSEAIREGAKLRPQVFTALFLAGGSCAIGAAIEAVVGNCPDRRRDGQTTYVSAYATIERLYKPLLDEGDDYASCPDCERTKDSVADVITHLNDEHRWTREQIADWLETEEEKIGFVHIVESEALNNQVALNHVDGKARSLALVK